jgi:hypothetical protein
MPHTVVTPFSLTMDSQYANHMTTFPLISVDKSVTDIRTDVQVWRSAATTLQVLSLPK